jgi:hypothetical protein
MLSWTRGSKLFVGRMRLSSGATRRLRKTGKKLNLRE